MSSDYEPSITPEMRARYLLRRRADIEALQMALAGADFASMKSIAHNIKGNASTFDHTNLEKLAIELEQHAENASLDSATLIIELMKNWLAHETSNS